MNSDFEQWLALQAKSNTVRQNLDSVRDEKRRELDRLTNAISKLQIEKRLVRETFEQQIHALKQQSRDLRMERRTLSADKVNA